MEYNDLLKKSEQGNTDSQLLLAHALKDGKHGITKNEQEAVRWLTISAEQGSLEAQLLLGTCYAEGTGVDSKWQTAVYWYRRAAESGLAEAQHKLANCYSRGEGVPQLIEEAAGWYKRSAELGHPQSQHQVALCYAQGKGLEQDWAEAVRWFSQAGEQGDLASLFSLASILENGTGTVCKDLERAASLYRKTAEKGHPLAQFRLGNCYYNGIGVTKDDKRAFRWTLAAAEQGNAEAQNYVGLSYTMGRGVAKNWVEAARWCLKAAEQGVPMAAETARFAQQQIIVQAGHVVKQDAQTRLRNARAKRIATPKVKVEGPPRSAEDAEHMAALLLLEEENERVKHKHKPKTKKTNKKEKRRGGDASSDTSSVFSEVCSVSSMSEWRVDERFDEMSAVCEVEAVLRQLTDDVVDDLEGKSRSEEQQAQALESARQQAEEVGKRIKQVAEKCGQLQPSLEEMQNKTALVERIVLDAQKEMALALEKKDLSKLRSLLHRVHSGYWKPFYKNKNMSAMIREAEHLAATLLAEDTARTALREAIEANDENALQLAIRGAERVDVSAKVAKKVLKKLQAGVLGSSVNQPGKRQCDGHSQIKDSCVTLDATERSEAAETSETAELSEVADAAVVVRLKGSAEPQSQAESCQQAQQTADQLNNSELSERSEVAEADGSAEFPGPDHYDRETAKPRMIEPDATLTSPEPEGEEEFKVQEVSAAAPASSNQKDTPPLPSQHSPATCLENSSNSEDSNSETVHVSQVAAPSRGDTAGELGSSSSVTACDGSTSPCMQKLQNSHSSDKACSQKKLDCPLPTPVDYSLSFRERWLRMAEASQLKEEEEETLPSSTEEDVQSNVWILMQKFPQSFFI
ncbi:hypothetical protein CYMTET_29148 [Cymbomonas tetramitiformis]|uniref:Uncharacterized protein n=1 Tax=Cymbomonas tetramitiformis TaxID=36881 RepID=A0AAE0KV80_9CHLO|nr:hypothetical protein CYMTET_29148 [Cymbomonas tetramitiformis]